MSTAVERISWSKYALSLACTASLRSEDPYRKVGACALDHSNRVLGVAYNGLKSGFTATADFWLDRDKRRPYMIHAEANLLSLFRRDECNIIAITHSPCASCAGLIVSHNIKRVVFCNTYEQDTTGIEILKHYNIDINFIDISEISNIIRNNQIWT